MSTLEHLNTLRVQCGVPALKGWKESKAKLAESIAKYEAKVGAQGPFASLAGQVKVDTLETSSSHTLQLSELNLPKTVKAARMQPQPVVKRHEDDCLCVTCCEAKGIVIKKCPPAKELRSIQSRNAQLDSIATRRVNGDTGAALPKEVVKNRPFDDIKRAAGEKQKRAHALTASRKGDGSTVTVADIARELGMDPKIARAKMRRVATPPEYLAGVHTFHAQHKDWVVDILKRDLRKGE